MDQDGSIMALGMEIDLSPGDFMLDGDPTPLPSPKRGRSPLSIFLAHFFCGQTAECIKMPVGIEVGLSPDDFVLHGDPAPPQKGVEPPNFRPMSIAVKRLDGS